MAMTKTIQATVKNRTDTAANWTSKNPVLAEGEIIVVQTSAGETRLKIGDGVKTFTQLPYTDEQIYNNVVTSVNGQTGDVILPGDFIVNVTSTDDINCTLDKTFDQIQEAVQAGKKVYAKLNGVFTIYMPMVLYSSFVLIFAATAFTSESIEQYVLAVPMSNSDGNNPQFLKKLAVTYNSDPTTGEKTMPQVDMSEDPVNNMQIATKKYVDNSLWYGADMEMSDTSTHPVRNMVIKKYVDDSTSNTLRYTAQTLTDEQKKQARDNIEAADADFIITATVASDNTCTTDKTFAQIQEAVQAGKKVYAKLKSRLTIHMPLVVYNTNMLIFGATISSTDNSEIYALVVTASEAKFVGKSVLTYNSDGDMPQVNMSSDPSEAMQIATKKYVDDHVSADVYVDFWPTGSEQYNGNFNGYQVELATDQTFDAIFDSIKAGNKIIARLYENAEKSELAASSVDASVTGTKEFGAIHFQFVTANADTGAIAGFPFIGEAIMMIKWEEAALSYLIENRNVLPTPNADGTDNGKVPIINGTKWELKTPTGGGSTNAVLYTPQTLTDEQKKQARNNVDAAIGDFSVTATIQNFPTCTLDKTFNQIQEAISKGKRVFAIIKFGGDGGLILPLFNSTSTEIQFTAFDYNNGLNRAQTYKLVVTTAESVLATGSAPMLTIDNTLRQVEMEAGPSFDMEIATKKYVDDKFSDKELILSSSTAGSTKKFKLTIDDTGTLTASEITA